MQYLYIPPTVLVPLFLFQKVYIDMMFMPKSNRYCYIIHACCLLFSYLEWHILHHKNGHTIGSFVFKDILCWWGAIKEIITNNSPAFVQAVKYLLKQYCINHIQISPYNSQANSPVEQWHFDVCESLVKVAEGIEYHWTTVAPLVFWAEYVSIQKSTGYSPYFLAHGVEPLFPFDLFEATYLALALTNPISSTNLIAYCAIQLQKYTDDLAEAKQCLLKTQWESVHQFEEAHKNLIKDLNFSNGKLVLVRNSQWDRDIGSKTKP